MTLPENTEIDVIQMLKDAQGDAVEVAKAQAHLKGQLDQALIDQMSSNPKMLALAKAIDEIRSIVDAIGEESELLPEPYSTIVWEVMHSVDVADDALVPLGL